MPPCEITLSIAPDGSLTAIYSDTLLALFGGGDAVTTRASHVEPEADGIHWYADLSPAGGPNLSGFSSRAAALAAEVDYLNGRLSAGTL